MTVQAKVLEAPAVVSVPALLTVAHAAQLLDCSAKTVRRRVAAGALAAVEENGRMMIRGDDLRAYVEGLEHVRGGAR